MNRSHVLLKMILAAFIFASCINSTSKTETEFAVSEHFDTQTSSSEVSNKRPIRYLPIPDYQNNMVMALLPVPSNWGFYKGDDKDIFLEGPNGIKGFYIQGDSYMYSPNNFLNQSYQQMGAEVKPFESIENQVQFLKQVLANDGFSMITINSFPLTMQTIIQMVPIA